MVVHTMLYNMDQDMNECQQQKCTYYDKHYRELNTQKINILPNERPTIQQMKMNEAQCEKENKVNRKRRVYCPG